VETSSRLISHVATESRHAGLRTVDVARRVGCSVQHLRDLEREGVLPRAERTPSGYRSWREVHVHSAVAYRELAQGVGPAPATVLLRALHREAPAVFLALLDDAHAALARERRDLRLAREAVAAIAAEPLTAPCPSDTMTISELADALGTTPASLRHWEAQGLFAAERAGHGRVHTYSPVQVRRRLSHPPAAHRRLPDPAPAQRPALAPGPPAPGPGAGHGAQRPRAPARERSHALLRAAAALHDALTAKGPGGGAVKHHEDES